MRCDDIWTAFQKKNGRTRWDMKRSEIFLVVRCVKRWNINLLRLWEGEVLRGRKGGRRVRWRNEMGSQRSESMRGTHAYIAARICASEVGWLAQHSLWILRLAYACIWADGLACLAPNGGPTFAGRSPPPSASSECLLAHTEIVEQNVRLHYGRSSSLRPCPLARKGKIQLALHISSACSLGKRGHLRSGSRDPSWLHSDKPTARWESCMVRRKACRPLSIATRMHPA